MSMGRCCTLAESTELGVYFNLWLWHKETMMNKEQNMTFYTDDIWNELEFYGKSRTNIFDYVRINQAEDDFISQLYCEAKDFGVLLSVKCNKSTGALYVYLRKNRG